MTDFSEVFAVSDLADDTWAVQLPHQCDEWDVANPAYGGAPHAQAVAALESFIADAQTALEALKARREREHGDRWLPDGAAWEGLAD